MIMDTTKVNLAVLFGGRSVEHEISIITALQAIQALDVTKYNIIPIYIAPSGHWYSGQELFNRSLYKSFSSYKNRLTEVRLNAVPDCKGLEIVTKGRGWRNASWLEGVADIIPIDVYLLAFHGEYGEDGCLQGLLELANAAYTGSSVMSMALVMNKYLCKSIVRDHGIPVLPSRLVNKFTAISDFDKAVQEILKSPPLDKFPLFVKPNSLGSSIGIGQAKDIQSLKSALMKVFRHDLQAIVEPCLQNMFEINVSVMGGRPAKASVVEIPVAAGGTLSYEDKYLRSGKKKGPVQSEGMAGLSRSIDPKHLDSSIKELAIEYALKAFTLLECSGVVRIDFIYDNSTEQLFFNELNPIPGSLSFYLWVKSKPQLLYTELLDRMIQFARDRQREKASLEKNIGFKAL